MYTFRTTTIKGRHSGKVSAFQVGYWVRLK